MKRTLFIAVIIFAALLSVNARAEVRQGDWIIGASSDFAFSRDTIKIEGDPDEETTKTFSIDFSGEKLITSNISLGLGINFTDEDSDDNGDYTSTMGMIYGTFWIQPEGNINPYFSLGFGWADMEIDTIDADGTGYGAVLGLLYFLNEHVALSFSYDYVAINVDVEGIDGDLDSIGLNAGLAIKF